MKKGFLFFICFVILPLYLPADDEIVLNENEDSFPEEVKGLFRSRSRIIELGLMNINIGLSNDYLKITEIFRDTLVLDVDMLEKGLKINFGVVFSPVYFNLNINDKWGVGLSTRLDAEGIVNASGNMLSLKEAENDKADAGGAAYAEIRLNSFFYISKFRIMIKPALYYPLVYIKPDISYTYKVGDSGPIFHLDYNFRLYSAWTQEEHPDKISLTALPGVDFYLGAQYPLSEVLGISKKIKYLDFDVGLEFINIPILPSAMKNYMEFSGMIGSAEPMNFFGGSMNKDSIVNNNDIAYNEEERTFMRPFKMLTWVDWRPFGVLFSFIPTVGFAINPLYIQPYSIEGGIKARLDVLNRFIAALGISYDDRLWKNSIDLVFNSRAIEFDLGVYFYSADFIRIWAGCGFGLNVGFKLGW